MQAQTDQAQFAEQLAQQLKGLDLPEAVSWWPMAFGWWLVIALSLLAISIGIIKFNNKLRQNKYRKIAITELKNAFKDWQQNDDTLAYLQSSNSILKRVIRQVEQDPNSISISKSGTAWSELLQQYAKQPISQETLSALTSECYQAKPNVDVTQVHGQINTWLTNHRSLHSA